MRIAFFTNNYLPRLGGSAISVNSLKESLEEIGVEVFVFAPNYQALGNYAQEKRIIRIRSFRFWWMKYASVPLPFLNVRKINRNLRRIKPDLIHIHQPFLLGRVGLKKGIDYNIPVVFTYHSLNEFYTHYFPFNQNLSKKIAEHYTLDCANKSNSVVAPTKAVANYLKKKGVKNNIEVVPTGINPRFYKDRFSLPERNEFKKRLGITLDRKILLYVGRVVAEKNINFLLLAAKRILRSRKDIVLIVVGDGILFNACRRFTKRLNLNGQIIWTGAEPPEKLPLYYQSADLLLFPSKTDTQAIVIYEALISGLPIIAVKSLASKSIIQEGKNGYLVSEDILEFSNVVIKNLDFKTKNSIYLSRKEYTSNKIAQRMYLFYQKIICKNFYLQKEHSTILNARESIK